MINLVLHDTCKPPFTVDSYWPAARIQSFHRHLCSTPDVVTNIAGDAQASLCPAFLTFGLDDLWIDDGDLAVLVLGNKNA